MYAIAVLKADPGFKDREGENQGVLQFLHLWLHRAGELPMWLPLGLSSGHSFLKFDHYLYAIDL